MDESERGGAGAGCFPSLMGEWCDSLFLERRMGCGECECECECERTREGGLHLIGWFPGLSWLEGLPLRCVIGKGARDLELKVVVLGK